MKILITTDLYAIKTNGVVTSVRNLCSELEQKGHDVRILTISEKMASHSEGNVYYIRSLPLGVVYPNVRVPATFRHRLIRELIDWKPDVIHSQCELFSFQFALHIARRTGAPIVHTYHTMYEHYMAYVLPSRKLGSHVVRFLSRKRLKKVDKVIVPTRKVEETLLGYGIKQSISVVPSGISLEQHRQRISLEERAENRRALGIRDDQLVLVNIGRLGTEKNVDELLQLFTEAIAKNENLVFLIVGDGPAKGELEHLAEKLGIAERVIFTGMVAPAEVQNYYQLGDLFVSASTSETQGLTYIEAAANGLPLLCREDKCLQDVIQQGENGYAYTSAAEFLESIDAIIANPEWRINAAKRSEEIASAYDRCNFGTAVEAIYKSVIGTSVE